MIVQWKFWALQYAFLQLHFYTQFSQLPVKMRMLQRATPYRL